VYIQYPNQKFIDFLHREIQKKIDEKGKKLTPNQAAKRIGVTRQCLMRYIEDIPGIEKDRTGYLIPESSLTVAPLSELPYKRGRKKK